jgi:hypothetical protein
MDVSSYGGMSLIFASVGATSAVSLRKAIGGLRNPDEVGADVLGWAMPRRDLRLWPRPEGPLQMKTFGFTYQPPIRRDLADPRSSGAPAQTPRKPMLNDRRSTR